MYGILKWNFIDFIVRQRSSDWSFLSNISLAMIIIYVVYLECAVFESINSILHYSMHWDLSKGNTVFWSRTCSSRQCLRPARAGASSSTRAQLAPAVAHVASARAASISPRILRRTSPFLIWTSSLLINARSTRTIESIALRCELWL